VTYCAKLIQQAQHMRLYFLDSIRGLAAFAVLLNHCFLALPDIIAKTYIVPLIKWTPLRVIMVGRPAVIIFFVLSGFALGLSLLNSKNTSYKSFMIRRVCRIYPPYVAAVLFSFLIYVLVQPQIIPTLEPWFNKNWGDGAGANIVAGHMLMVNRPQDASLNSVVWSLAYEMRISLLFPVLFIIARLAGLRVFLGLTLGFTLLIEGALSYFHIDHAPFHNAGWLDGVLSTLHFIVFFAGGLVMAMHMERLGQVAAKLPWYAALFLWLVAGATLTSYNDFIGGLGAVLIIGLSLGSIRVQNLLHLAPLKWLGKVSYSLYLFHLPILLAATHLFYGKIPIWAYLVPASVLSLVVAGLAYRFIEEPSINMGRALSAPKLKLQAAE
jgi:peptidoglycan/LPS O-acetylase OafA/YrhL